MEYVLRKNIHLIDEITNKIYKVKAKSVFISNGKGLFYDDKNHWIQKEVVENNSEYFCLKDEFKVGDYIKYFGITNESLTNGKIYKIVEVKFNNVMSDSDSVHFIDDNGNIGWIVRLHFNLIEKCDPD